jgi:hypothetical protein
VAASTALGLSVIGSVSASPVAPVNGAGNEYQITPGIPGDQIAPAASFNAAGGYVVWQDNSIDGDGWGIGALRLDQSLSPAGSVFRVNSIATGDQTAPKIAVLPNGNALVVWQGGPSGGAQIYARIVKPDQTFTTASDILVSTNVATGKITPAMAVLLDGSVIVAWASYGQDDALNGDAQRKNMLGIYAQRLDSQGNRMGGEFLVNQTVIFNQRAPAVAALSDGSYVVAWASESLSGAGAYEVVNGVNTLYRKFLPSGAALTPEIQANDHQNTCATPTVSAAPGGGFTLAWVEQDADNSSDGFDVVARAVSANGYPASDSYVVNAYVYGDQFAPQIVGAGGMQMTVWSSLGQGGHKEGVFGRFISGGGIAGAEVQLNTTTVTPKQRPYVAATPGGGFLALWDSYALGGLGYEIYAQRMQTTWPAMAVPTITALATNQLMATWNPIRGFNNVVYRVYMDGNAASPTTLTNWYSPPNLAPGSLHTFRLGYMASGVISPEISAAASGATLSSNPSASQLETVKQTVAGSQLELSWMTTPGKSYQLQYFANGVWVNLIGPRKATGNLDFVLVKEKKGSKQYRVVKL